MRAGRLRLRCRLFWRESRQVRCGVTKREAILCGWLFAFGACEALGCGDANRDSVALEGDGGVEGIDVGADDAHEVGVGRGDVDLTGGGSVADGEIVGMAIRDAGAGQA